MRDAFGCCDSEAYHSAILNRADYGFKIACVNSKVFSECFGVVEKTKNQLFKDVQDAFVAAEVELA